MRLDAKERAFPKRDVAAGVLKRADGDKAGDWDEERERVAPCRLRQSVSAFTHRNTRSVKEYKFGC